MFAKNNAHDARSRPAARGFNVGEGGAVASILEGGLLWALSPEPPFAEGRGDPLAPQTIHERFFCKRPTTPLSLKESYVAKGMLSNGILSNFATRAGKVDEN